MTCVVLSYAEPLSVIREILGSKEWEAVRVKVEQVVRSALERHGLREVLNTNCTITALSVDPSAAVECCLDVESTVASLGLKTGEKVEPSWNNGRAAGNTDVFLRVSMGLSTGLVKALKQESRSQVYYGPCVVEATRIATEVNPGLIVTSLSTWYALSHTESRLVRAGGVFPRRLTDCLRTYILNFRRTTMDLFVIGRGAQQGVAVQPQVGTGQAVRPPSGNTRNNAVVDDDDPFSGGRVWDPSEMLASIVRRVPVEARHDMLIALCRQWKVTPPFRDPYSSREGYCEILVSVLSVVLFETSDSDESEGDGVVGGDDASSQGMTPNAMDNY